MRARIKTACQLSALVSSLAISIGALWITRSVPFSEFVLPITFVALFAIAKLVAPKATFYQRAMLVAGAFYTGPKLLVLAVQLAVCIYLFAPSPVILSAPAAVLVVFVFIVLGIPCCYCACRIGYRLNRVVGSLATGLTLTVIVFWTYVSTASLFEPHRHKSFDEHQEYMRQSCGRDGGGDDCGGLLDSFEPAFSELPVYLIKVLPDPTLRDQWSPDQYLQRKNVLSLTGSSVKRKKPSRGR